MEYAVAFRTSLTIIVMMGGMMVFFVVLVNMLAKIQTKNKWYVEFNNRGEITFQLAPDTGGVVSTKHGEYNLPDRPRMMIGWPLGLPAFMQVTVRHEKYVHGNPDPLDIPNMEEDVGLAVLSQQSHLADAKSMETVVSVASSIGGRNQGLMIFMAVAVTLAVIAGGVAAYFGYQIDQSQAAVVSALGGL